MIELTCILGFLAIGFCAAFIGKCAQLQDVERDRDFWREQYRHADKRASRLVEDVLAADARR